MIQLVSVMRRIKLHYLDALIIVEAFYILFYISENILKMPPSPAAKKRKSEHHIKESATSLKDDIKGNPTHMFGY